MGIVIPKIRIVDNMLIEPTEYCIKLKGVEAGRGKIPNGRYPHSIIGSHLNQIIEDHAADILGLQNTKEILDTLRKEYPAVVDAVLMEGSGLTLVEIRKILQNLLREKVAIRDMVSILEAIADFIPRTKDILFLTEKVRQALARQIYYQYAVDGTLQVMTLDPAIEQKIIESKCETSTGIVSALDPSTHKAWIKAVDKAIEVVTKQKITPVILCSEAARFLVKNSTDREFPQLAVLSVLEIALDIKVESIGVIRPELSEDSSVKDSEPETNDNKNLILFDAIKPKKMF
jgi:flagellar biosynthesis protein FlhA